MKVKFIGNPHDPSDNRGFIEWHGVRFTLNEPMDLPQGKLFEKIPANSHFEVVQDDWDYNPAEADKTVAETPPADEKAELIAFAEQHGVKIDKRWSVAKITAAIEDAAAEAEKAE